MGFVESIAQNEGAAATSPDSRGCESVIARSFAYSIPRITQIYYSQLKIPAYMGRLPALMGIPAGGSLTADQWSIAATVVLPLAVRHTEIVSPVSHLRVTADTTNLG